MDITSISAVVAAMGVLIGVVLTILELRNLVKTRQMDLLMDLYLSWGTEDMKRATGRFLGLEIKDYDDFVKKHGPVVSVEPERSQIHSFQEEKWTLLVSLLEKFESTYMESPLMRNIL